jgi:hypothetical protein
MNNPIVELAEYCQSVFKQSILTEVLGKTGPDHNPVVEVQGKYIYGVTVIKNNESKGNRAFMATSLARAKKYIVSNLT